MKIKAKLFKRLPNTVPQTLIIAWLGFSLIATPLAGISAEKEKRSSATRTQDTLNNDEKIVHVLNRLGYGARPGDVERVRQMGIEKYIDLQLNPDRIDDHAAQAHLSGLNTLAMKPDELL